MKVSVTAIVMAALVAVVCLFPGGGTGGTKAATASSAVEITDGRSYAAGVYIGSGLVVTARHVVRDTKGAMTVIDTRGERVSASTYWISPTTDVAVVQLRGVLHIAAALLDKRIPAVGEPVEVVGTPLGHPFVHTYGKVIKPLNHSEWRDAIQISAKIKPGNSGGPAYDRDGKVIGIVVGALMSRATHKPIANIMISVREIALP